MQDMILQFLCPHHAMHKVPDLVVVVVVEVEARRLVYNAHTNAYESPLVRGHDYFHS